MKNPSSTVALAVLTAILSVMLMPTGTSAQNRDLGGLALTRQWNEYYSAADADRPQKQLQILEQIRKDAASGKYWWDAYEAARLRAEVRSSINWKDSQSAREDFRADVYSFGQPVAEFRYMLAYEGASAERLVAFIKENAKAMKAGCCKPFHKGGPFGRFSEIVAPSVTNDYEYAVWAAFFRDSGTREHSSDLARSVAAGRYPFDAVVEFTCMDGRSSGSERNAALAAYVKKYDGRAASMLAREVLLRDEYWELQGRESATTYDFKAFHAKCQAFEKDRKAFSGQEGTLADLCTNVESIISDLEEKNIEIHASDGRLTLVLQNLDGAVVDVRSGDGKGKSVYRTSLKNPACSFYLKDTVKIDFPAFDDGDYVISAENGGVETRCDYGKHSISASVRRDRDNWRVYAADYLTGEPVEKVEIRLFDKEKMIGTVAGVFLNGFTRVPEEIGSLIVRKKDYYSNYQFELRYTDAAGLLHLSEKLYVRPVNVQERVKLDVDYAEIFPDRSAFNPGETVQFKVVAYHGDMSESLHTVEAGVALTARLYDPQGNELSSQKLVTNDFGSAAGRFVLDRAARNGMFRITVSRGKDVLCSTSVRSDDFVLPTYDVRFNGSDVYYVAGDRVSVKGVAKSYSGHSLAGAKILCTVTKWGQEVLHKDVAVDRDGGFEVVFDAKDYGYYNVRVRVTDATGETREFSTGVNVSEKLNISAVLKNAAEASVEPYRGGCVPDGDKALVSLTIPAEGNPVRCSGTAVSVEWTVVSAAGKTVASGVGAPGDVVEVDLSGRPSGEYMFKARAAARQENGTPLSAEDSIKLIRLGESDTSIDVDVENIFRVLPGDDISFQMACARGPVWACVEIFDASGKVLVSDLVHLNGRRGQDGSVKLFKWAFDKSWGNAVRVNVLYFRGGNTWTWSRDFSRNDTSSFLPLSVESLTDVTLPSTEYIVTFASRPDVEMAVSVFDKSTETIMPNRWNTVRMEQPQIFYVGYVNIAGSVFGHADYYGDVLRVTEAGMMSAKAFANSVVAYDSAIEEESAVMLLAEDSSANGSAVPQNPAEGIVVRENFANTLAFEPFLRSDASGRVEMKFKTSDKLSTYVLSAFAHDRDMKNDALRREFVVTVPVKAALVQPQYLYAGDRYAVRATLSSTIKEDVSGTLSAAVYDGTDYRNGRPLLVWSKPVTVEAGGTLADNSFVVDVPSGLRSGTLGILLTFKSSDGSFSDAVFVPVPVFDSVQTLTEAHSAVLRAGGSLDSLVASLRKQFVNVSGADAEMKVVSILDMVKDAVPSLVKPSGKDVLSLTEAYYAGMLAGSLEVKECAVDSLDAVVKKILGCRNSDGGFAWFEGMDSSPVITAVVLKRLASLRSRGILPSDAVAATAADAVKYLDREFFGKSIAKARPYRCGGVTMEEYLLVRSMWPDVAFQGGTTVKSRKAVRAYLVPSGRRGLNARIFAKAVRMKTLYNLSSGDDAVALARALGVRTGAARRISASLDADRRSLLEYAVEHRGGGIYYPNLVMPLRGLMDSELFAHSLLCDLFRDLGEDAAADGIRLWMMVQKETQQWGDDPAFIEALSSVLDASKAVLETKVVSLSRTFEIPFKDIRAAGNGFTVSRVYSVVGADGGRRVLADGDRVKVGDKIVAEYRIWNGENRSFVRLSAARPASLRPENQLSGIYGWWLRPILVDGWYSVSPQGYRNVLSDRTEYWFDSYPEENTTVTETLFVTQEGAFTAPVLEIECLYAPHYRANDAFRGVLESE